MSATPGELPVGPGWAYEMGWDGPRVLVEVAGTEVRVLDADAPADTDGAAGVDADGGTDADGDAPADADGGTGVDAGAGDGRRTDAAELELSWAHDISDALLDGHLVLLTGAGAAVFVAGDLLRLYGVDLRERPYAQRRDTLERLAAARPTLTVSPRFDDADATDAAARQHGLPGVVAKRLDSRYLSGRRSEDWIERRFDTDRSRP